VTALAPTVFDQKRYVELIEARGETIRKIVPELRRALNLSTALDAGCGLGFFSDVLRECGLLVHGFDGRAENVAEAQRRYPGIPFELGDVEDCKIKDLGSFDLVLCFGLLYHLESPLKAIRNLRALAKKVLFVESMCLPTFELQIILREEPRLVDQSLSDLALYPSEGSIVKMLFRSGFKYVYRTAVLPDHDEFRETPYFRRRRTVLLASSEPILIGGLIPLDEPCEASHPWQKQPPRPPWPQRLKRLWQRPARINYAALTRRIHSRFSRAVVPVRLRFGVWWLTRVDDVSKAILEERFENYEFNFVRRFLEPGMTVLDIGAHHGLYSLLSARMVGPRGSVFSFEPSPREFRALRRHVRINFLLNIKLQPLALGDENETADLHVVDPALSGCNSLRSPGVLSNSAPIPVRVMRLDDWAATQKVTRVDFVKLDVEGGELAVIRGARQLLRTKPRPVILAEVQDSRTSPWGYRAKEIVVALEELGYRWFQPSADGSLREILPSQDFFDANLIAVPEERVSKVLSRVGSDRNG